MNLRWRQFEREARRGIKQELRAAPPETKRKASRARRDYGRAIAVPVLVLYGWTAITLGYGAWAANRLGSGLVVAVFTSIPVIALIALFWHVRLAAQPEAIWYVLPLSREQIYRHRMARFHKGFLFWGMLIIVAYAAVYVRGEIHSPRVLFAVSVFQIVVIWACALHLVAYFSHAVGRLAQVSLLTAVVVVVAPALESTSAAFREAAPVFSLLLPTGWTHHFFLGAGWRDWLLIVPLALLLAAIPASLNRVRTRFLQSPFWQADAAVEISGMETDDDDEAAPGSTPKRGWSEIYDTLDVDLRKTTRQREGWIETLVENAWSDDQRNLADFMWPGGRGWTAGWRRALKCTFVCVGLVILARFLFAWPMGEFLVLVAGGLGSLQAAPIFASAAAFRPMRTTSGFSPLYAPFPVSATAMYRTIRISSVIRWITWMPIAVVYGAAVALLARLPAAYGARIGLGFAALMFAIQPVMTTMTISRNTSIVRPGWKLAFAGIGFLTIGLLVVFAVALLEPEAGGLRVQATACAAIWLASKSAQLLWQYLQSRGGIDLFHKPQTPYTSAR